MQQKFTQDIDLYQYMADSERVNGKVVQNCAPARFFYRLTRL